MHTHTCAGPRLRREPVNYHNARVVVRIRRGLKTARPEPVEERASLLNDLLVFSLEPQQAPSRLLVLLLRSDLPVQQAFQSWWVDTLAFQHHPVEGLELLLPRLVGLDVLLLPILAGGHVLSIRRTAGRHKTGGECVKGWETDERMREA